MPNPERYTNPISYYLNPERISERWKKLSIQAKSTLIGTAIGAILAIVSLHFGADAVALGAMGGLLIGNAIVNDRTYRATR